MCLKLMLSSDVVRNVFDGSCGSSLLGVDIAWLFSVGVESGSGL